MSKKEKSTDKEKKNLRKDNLEVYTSYGSTKWWIGPVTLIIIGVITFIILKYELILSVLKNLFN